MGNVFIVYQISPEDNEFVPKIEEQLKEIKIDQVELREIKVETIAFGIQVIKAAFVMPDKIEGLMTQVEEAVNKLEHTQGSEVVAQTLL